MEKYLNFEQISESNFLKIKQALEGRIENEQIPHFKIMVKRASDAFASAMEANNVLEKENALFILNHCKNYLTEKYRDSRDQVDYIFVLNQAIEYLKSQLTHLN